MFFVRVTEKSYYRQGDCAVSKETNLFAKRRKQTRLKEGNKETWVRVKKEKRPRRNKKQN